MEENRDTNVVAKVVCAVVLAVIVVAAGVGLLVQHRKLDESRKARADLEKANWQLSVGREELVSANGKLAEELRQLREVGRARATDKAALERERAAWKVERDALSGRLASAEASLKAAREAQSRAETEVAGLKAAVKDMTAVEKKLRAERDKIRSDRDKIRSERDKIRSERDRLEHELNDAMTPAMEEADDVPPPATLPTSESEEVAVPVPPAPNLDKRTPEERAAHEKKELNDLIGL